MYLDKAGLGACWREALLAKKVLEGKTKGYKNHPQLTRFKEHRDPVFMLDMFLTTIWNEACNRSYNYDGSKITSYKPFPRAYLSISVNRGQLVYEACHLNSKLIKRQTEGRIRIPTLEKLECNPIFEPCNGDIESWEKI